MAYHLMKAPHIALQGHLLGNITQPGNLPLLEFALTELWQRQNERALRHIAYEEIGQVKGALSEEQKVKLLEIANKCPVHRTISSKPTIEDTIEVVD